MCAVHLLCTLPSSANPGYGNKQVQSPSASNSPSTGETLQMTNLNGGEAVPFISQHQPALVQFSPVGPTTTFSKFIHRYLLSIQNVVTMDRSVQKNCGYEDKKINHLIPQRFLIIFHELGTEGGKEPQKRLCQAGC